MTRRCRKSKRWVTAAAPLGVLRCNTLTSQRQAFAGCRIQLFQSSQLQKAGCRWKKTGRDLSQQREERRRKQRETKDECVNQNGPNQTQVNCLVLSAKSQVLVWEYAGVDRWWITVLCEFLFTFSSDLVHFLLLCGFDFVCTMAEIWSGSFLWRVIVFFTQIELF